MYSAVKCKVSEGGREGGREVRREGGSVMNDEYDVM